MTSKQEEATFANSNGCLPAKSKLPYKFPGGLDILKIQYDHLPNKKLLAFQSQFFRKLDPTFSIHLFGGTGYITTDPRNVEAVCNSRFSGKLTSDYAIQGADNLSEFGLGTRRDGCLRFLGEGIFVHDGPAWKHSREVLRRQFARVNTAGLADILEEYVEGLVSSLAKEDGLVDLQPAFFHFTLLTTTALLFGEAVTVLAVKDQKDFEQSFERASEVTAIRLRLADLFFLYTPKSFKRSCDIVKRFADHFVQKALAHQETHGKDEALKHFPFILELYEDLKDPILVRDQLVNVLLAGRDTTACTLSWAFCKYLHLCSQVTKYCSPSSTPSTEAPKAADRSLGYSPGASKSYQAGPSKAAILESGSRRDLATLPSDTHQRQVCNGDHAPAQRRWPRRRVADHAAKGHGRRAVSLPHASKH